MININNKIIMNPLGIRSDPLGSGSSGGARKSTAIPHGFDDFAYLWNIGASDNDDRQISRIYVSEDTSNYSVNTTTTPVLLTNFFITPDQVGLATPSNTGHDSPPPRNILQDDYYDAPPRNNPGSYYFNESSTHNHPRDPFHVVSDRAHFRDNMEHRRNSRQGYAYRQEQRA